MPGRIPILEPDVPNNIVYMVTSERELRGCYYMLVFIPFMSALVGFGMAQIGDTWWEWALRGSAMVVYSVGLVFMAKTRFSIWRTKGELLR